MGSSPLWGLILLAIVLGPIVAAIVQPYVQIGKDLRDVQNGGRGW